MFQASQPQETSLNILYNMLHFKYIYINGSRTNAIRTNISVLQDTYPFTVITIIDMY